MCIAFFGLDAFPDHPDLAFLLAFGRDEYLTRPSEPAHFWPDAPLILAGRDMQAKGTWLGVSSSGRLAFLTNLRERDPEPDSHGPVPHASRGNLTTAFLLGQDTPQQYMQRIQGDSYHGFNLVVADLLTGEMLYTANPFPPENGQAGGAPGPQDQLPPTPAAAAASEPKAAAVPEPPGCCRSGVCPSEAVGPGRNHVLVEAGGGAGDEGGRQGAASMRAQVLASPIVLQRGRVYGLSNGLLNEWAKVHAGVRDLKHHMTGDQKHDQGQDPDQSQGQGKEASADGSSRPLPWSQIFGEVLGNSDKDESCRPACTGPDQEAGAGALSVEYVCSSRFIHEVEVDKLGPYGTRSQIVLAVWKDGGAELRERYLDAPSRQWRDVRHCFQVKR